MLKKFYASGGTAHKHRQHTGSHGIQRAAVADAPGLQHTPQLRDHILAGPAFRLIYNYDSVHIKSPA